MYGLVIDLGSSRWRWQQMLVDVYDYNLTHLSPCSAAKARILIKKGRAIVILTNPMTIRLIK
jgi:hypothetical protein